MFPTELRPEFVEAWYAAGRHLLRAGGDRIRFLSKGLFQPLVVHHSFLFGNQIYFVFVHVKGGPEFYEGLGPDSHSKIAFDSERYYSELGSRFVDAAKAANAHACLLPMVKVGETFEPRGKGWGLHGAPVGSPSVNPELLGTDERIEMSDWEVRDMAAQVIGDWLRQRGAKIFGYNTLLGIDPQIWYERGRGPEYVVVRGARYPDVEAAPPDNLDELIEAQRDYSNLGHFASVPISGCVEDGGHPSRLIRGGPLSIPDPDWEPLRPIT